MEPLLRTSPNKSNLNCFNDDHFIAVPEKNLFCPKKIAQTAGLVFNKGIFTLRVEKGEYTIRDYNVKGLPHNLTNEQLIFFLSIGYFSIGLAGDEYTVDAKIRLLGGGKKQNARMEFLQAKTEIYTIANRTGWTPREVQMALRKKKLEIYWKYDLDYKKVSLD